MRPDDPRFATFPQTPGSAQLRWYIDQAARGVLSIEEFLAEFRRLHESAERVGPPAYGSPEEARAIWDVLWAVEFASPEYAASAGERYRPDQVLTVVKRAAAQLSKM